MESRQCFGISMHPAICYNTRGKAKIMKCKRELLKANFYLARKDKKVYEINSYLCRKRKLNSLIVLGDSDSR